MIAMSIFLTEIGLVGLWHPEIVQLQSHLHESDGQPYCACLMNRFADFMASLMASKAFNLTMSFSPSSIDLGLLISWSVFMVRYAAI